MAEQSFRKITDFLDSIIGARLQVRRQEAGMVLLLGVLGVFLLAPAAVLAQPHFGYSAVVYAGLTISLLLGVLARCWWLVTRRQRREGVALDIEEQHEDLGSNLISSLQLFPRKGEFGTDDPTSPALIDALVNDTAREVESLAPDAFVSHALFQRLGRLASVLAVAAALMAFVWPGLYPRAGYLLANAADLMPSRITHLAIEANRTTALAGMSVSFEVRTAGRETSSVNLEIDQGAGVAAMLSMKKVAPHRFVAAWAASGAGARVAARTGRFRSEALEIRVVAPPRVESIDVVQYPPEYTKLKPVVGKRGGHVRGYMGSEVHLRVRTNKPVHEAVISLADGWRLPLKPEEGDVLGGKMILGGAGSYQVRLKDAHGFSNLAPARYRVDIIPDAYPRVAVTEPAKDLTVESDEKVTARYSASDDFGLKGVYLEVALDGRRPRRIKMWGGEDARKSTRGFYEFEPGVMGVRAGGVLSYRFLARDGDTVSGPKVGVSKTYRIRVRDREAVMAGLDRNLGDISRQLLDLLGDYLEKDFPPGSEEKKAPAPARSARHLEKKAERILERIKRTRATLKPRNPRETLSDMDLSTLERQLRDAISQYLAPLNRLSQLKKGDPETARLQRQMAARQEEATESFERLATMSEEMQRNVRADRAGRTTEAMIQRQRGIERALEEMRKSGADAEAIKRVQRELRNLERQLGELMQQMASLAQRMPTEFMNQRGMRDMPTQNMMRAFEDIRRMMQRNDFRGALERLRRLMSQLQRMRMALRGMQRRQMMSQRGGRPMRRQQSELASIVEEQQAILGETVSVLENVVDRIRKTEGGGVAAVARSAADLAKRSGEEVARPLPPDCFPKSDPATSDPPKKAEAEKSVAETPPPPLARRRASPQMRAEQIQRERLRALAEFESMVGKGEWGIVFQRLAEWRGLIEKSPCVRSAREPGTDAPKKPAGEGGAAWRRFAESLDALLGKAEKGAGGTEVAKLDGLRFRQESLRKRLSAFEQQLRRMMQVYPFINPEILRRIVGAGEAMKQAVASLERRRASHAVPPEEEAIRKLAQGQNAMQNAMQQMAQRGNVGLGTPRGFGVLRPGRGQRPWWSRSPTFPRQPGFEERGRGEEGGLGTQFSEVLIPDREQYKVPAKFREEIMEAMKDGLPGAMRGEIEDYFDRLTK